MQREGVPRCGLARVSDGGSRRGGYVPVAREWMESHGAPFQRAFVVRFAGACKPVPENADALVVLDYEEGRSGRAIVLDDRLYRALGVVWTRYIVLDRVSLWRASDRPEERRAMFGEFLSDEQITELKDYGYPFLKALDERYLKDKVLGHARAVAGRSHTLDEWQEAFRAILDHARDGMDFWGFRFERRLGARLAPFVLLGLCFSFWYRARRIDPAGDLRSEPWIVLGPRGWLETAGAVAWALLTMAAVAGVWWAMAVFEAEDSLAVPDDLRREIAAEPEGSDWRTARMLVRAYYLWGGLVLIAAGGLLVHAWTNVYGVARTGRRTGVGCSIDEKC